VPWRRTRGRGGVNGRGRLRDVAARPLDVVGYSQPLRRKPRYSAAQIPAITTSTTG